ncbi:MAG: NAD(P)H-quinone oxidoreductase subunit 4 [Thermosynechococcaceae cyanobacterium]
MLTQIPWLTILIAFPVLGAIAIPFLPDSNGKTIRWYALSTALAELTLMVYAFWDSYTFSLADLQLSESYAWVPQIGLNWSLAVDGLSMPLILLTGFINVLAIFAAWNVTKKTRLFFSLMLLLLSAQVGVFAAQDILLFFLMWEIELIPVYLLISIWGGPQRQYAATKFILYTAVGSIFILLAGLAMAFYGDTTTFDMAALAQKHYPLGFEMLSYAGFLIAFGVKLPIFPFHTWLPDAHGEASAPVSMVLAGVLLKMGGYGLIRMNIQMLPEAHIHFAPILAVLGVVNIVYGALNAFSQANLKRCLACSSISHMGFVLIGIATLSDLGLNGAVLQMVSHGLIAAALFFLAGVTYERTGTLTIDKMGGMAKVMPTAFALFTISGMASLALPGMSGFIGELTIFLGIANTAVYTSSFKVIVIMLAAVGLILTPIYLLSMIRRVFCGKASDQVASSAWLDAQPREVFIAVCLILPIIGIGLYPKVVMQTYDVTTMAIAETLEQQVTVVAQQGHFSSALALQKFNAPDLTSSQRVLGTISPAS